MGQKTNEKQKMLLMIEYSKILQQEYLQMLRTKKSSFEVNRDTIIQQKIRCYIENRVKAQQQFCESFKDFLLGYGIPTHFNNLEEHLQLEMIQQVKKNSIIEDGVYLLLEGSLVYTWVKNRNDRGRREHLFSLAKIYSFSNLSESAPDRDLLLTNGYSVLIHDPMSVVECQNGNIATCQDCVLLKIPLKVLEITQFSKLKIIKQQAFSKAKLPQIRVSTVEKVVSLNCNLHHTLKNKRLTFRSKFQVQSLAVIIDGSVLLRKREQNKSQISKYSLILPHIEYEVSSAWLQIIEVTNNPTITFSKPQIIEQIIEEYKMQVRRNSEHEQRDEVKKYRHQIRNSVSLHKSANEGQAYKELNRKKKQCRLFSKQNQEFWIVSSELSQQNMENMKIAKKNSIRCADKRPKILFNYSKKLRNSQDAKQNSGTNGQLVNFRESQMSKRTLMQRYEIYSKKLFKEYKEYMRTESKKKKLRKNNEFQNWKIR